MSAFVFAIVFLCGSMVVLNLHSADEEAAYTRNTQVASNYAHAIEKVLQHALSSTNALAVMVHQGNGKVPDFTTLVSYILPLYKGAFALSLAPEGVIRQIEPALPNALVKDHDLFDGQDREVVISGLKEGELTFWGPFKLIQGPQGAIGSMPVFLKNAQGEKYFWGYTIVTLKFPSAFEDANLKSLEAQGYAYQLTGLNPETNVTEIIEASSVPLSGMITRVPVRIFGTTWELGVSKVVSWRDTAKLVIEFLVVLIGAGLMAWLTYSVVTMAHQRRKLHDIAMYDPLTGLPNRRLLDIDLGKAMTKARENKTDIVVCYLDLDGFKSINDTMGHAAGDLLLTLVSERLRSCLRNDDILSRLGGDEFVVVLARLGTLKEITTVLDRILFVVGQPAIIDGVEIVISASIGAATCHSGNDEADRLLRSADEAMYIAKRTGKNKYFIADNSARSCSA